MNRYTKVKDSSAVRDNKSGAVLFKSNQKYLIAKNRKITAQLNKKRDVEITQLRSDNKKLEQRLQKLEQLLEKNING